MWSELRVRGTESKEGACNFIKCVARGCLAIIRQDNMQKSSFSRTTDFEAGASRRRIHDGGGQAVVCESAEASRRRRRAECHCNAWIDALWSALRFERWNKRSTGEKKTLRVRIYTWVYRRRRRREKRAQLNPTRCVSLVVLFAECMRFYARHASLF